MTKLKVYLATPYSHESKARMEFRYQCAMRAAARLMEQGHVVFSPIAHSHEIGKFIGKQAGGHLDQDIHTFWMQQDLPWLLAADVVYVLTLDGWESSRGVQEEIVYARKHGKHIEFLSMDHIGAEYPTYELEPAAPAVTVESGPPAVTVEAPLNVVHGGPDLKDTNPKDMIGTRKAPLSTVPMGVIAEIGVGMLEGASKYGRHNFRAAGIRASVYFDAAMRHMIAWWEGEDIDRDSGVNHVAKALTTLVVLRDAMHQGIWTDDRPPRSKPFYAELNAHAAAVIDRYADRNPRHYTIADSKVQP